MQEDCWREILIFEEGRNVGERGEVGTIDQTEAPQGSREARKRW
jgi:hypothetical protein